MTTNGKGVISMTLNGKAVERHVDDLPQEMGDLHRWARSKFSNVPPQQGMKATAIVTSGSETVFSRVLAAHDDFLEFQRFLTFLSDEDASIAITLSQNEADDDTLDEFGFGTNEDQQQPQQLNEQGFKHQPTTKVGDAPSDAAPLCASQLSEQDLKPRPSTSMVEFSINGSKMSMEPAKLPQAVKDLGSHASLIDASVSLGSPVYAMAHVSHNDSHFHVPLMDDACLAAIWERALAGERVELMVANSGRIDGQQQKRDCHWGLLGLLVVAMAIGLAIWLQGPGLTTDRHPEIQMTEFAKAHVRDGRELSQNKRILDEMLMENASSNSLAIILEAPANSKASSVQSALNTSKLPREVIEKVTSLVAHSGKLQNQFDDFVLDSAGQASMFTLNIWVSKEDSGKVNIALMLAIATFKKSLIVEEMVPEMVYQIDEVTSMTGYRNVKHTPLGYGQVKRTRTDASKVSAKDIEDLKRYLVGLSSQKALHNYAPSALLEFSGSMQQHQMVGPALKPLSLDPFQVKEGKGQATQGSGTAK